jgi:AcrR family transcriptional regulator
VADPIQDPQPDTRTRLLEAAIHCFAEKGFEGTGIRDIAQRAQANSALVQYHFGGKEGLYEEAFRFLFSHKHTLIAGLAPAPDPRSPGARESALLGLREHIAAFCRELLGGSCDPRSGDLERAAGLLWSRESQDPRPGLREFLHEVFRPYTEHLEGFLRVLRPDLEDERLFEFGMSIHGMILSYRTHLGLARLLRGDEQYPRDLDALTAHFVDFTFRGLGLADALPPQGA